MRGSRIGWSTVVAACVMAGPAGATHHKAVHAKPTHHETSHHKASARYAASTHHDKEAHHVSTHRSRDTRHASHATHEERKPAAAAGAISVPAGGTKLYCGPGKSPLMVRKMTQGAGTSVTVICR